LIIGCGGGGSSGGGGNPPTVTPQIAAGSNHSLALDNDGNVYATGYNFYGQLGFAEGNTTNSQKFEAVPSLNGINVKAIVAGDIHSLALRSDGKLYAAGFNGDGELGFAEGNTTNSQKFEAVASLNGITIKAIDAGKYHSLALRSDGKLYATGYNNSGQLGFAEGNTTDSRKFELVPSLNGITIKAIAAGNLHSLALTDDGNVYATGYNYYGNLGFGEGNTTNSQKFELVPSLNGISIEAIAAGAFHSLALTSDDKLYATGKNDVGRLGFGEGNTTDSEVFTPAAPF
jgi:alpha-tubulin suppressor-like RCC1 family protein